MNLPLNMEMSPAGFVETSYRESWNVRSDENQMWSWLNKTDTFVAGQVGPYTVEFQDHENPDNPRFAPGVLTNHYGPFLNAAGVIGEMREKSYRDLRYYYGSYVFFFSLVRPSRLQFFYDQEKKVLTMQLDAFVKPWFQGIWMKGMRFFWPRFGRWMEKSNGKAP
ncbi:MAG: hypothetical protein AAF203_02700 [Pseudomonadota bacterium]